MSLMYEVNGKRVCWYCKKDFNKNEEFTRDKVTHDYKGTESPIPHHWMPKWQDTNDPSGRVMPAFSENVE